MSAGARLEDRAGTWKIQVSLRMRLFATLGERTACKKVGSGILRVKVERLS